MRYLLFYANDYIRLQHIIICQFCINYDDDHNNRNNIDYYYYIIATDNNALFYIFTQLIT